MHNAIKPLATTQPESSGFGWGSVNGGISDALDIWGKVEKVKKVKASTGQDLAQAKYQPELANGAARQVDASLALPKSDNGLKINKPLLYVSFGLLGLAFIMRMKGFR